MDPGERYACAAALAAALAHATSAPDDVVSVNPQTFSPTGNADTDDAHAQTIPAPIPTDRPPAVDPAIALGNTLPSAPTPVVASARPKQSDVSTVPPAPPTPAGGLGARVWIMLIAVAVVSIGLGVLLSLLGLGN
jgi:hypothetical protein